jgi:CheY-like chemotaxis protein
MADKPSIFVVEDNPANLRLICDLLKANGFHVSSTNIGEDVVCTVIAQHPALILMDISLNGQSGLDLTRELKTNPLTAAIPVVALTAHTTPQDKANAMEAGCAGFIAKPVSTRSLPKQLLEYLYTEDT